ncbi:MAG: TRAP transporter small permease, partial [Spirochaetes bacterium]|nr:TRAP transporter small permease [Spirochaetota bacterium]
TVLTIGDILSALFWVLVFVTGISITLMVAPQRSPSMNLPMWIAYIAVPVGSACSVIELVFIALKRVKAREKGRS